MGLNAGPHFTFNEAVSFFVACETQQEVDELWDKLLADGGKPTQCGWLKDQFGLSWQIIPNVLPQAARRLRPRQGRPGDAGDDADGEDRRPGAAARLRRRLDRATAPEQSTSPSRR